MSVAPSTKQYTGVCGELVKPGQTARTFVWQKDYTGTVRCLDRTGDTKLLFNRHDPQELAATKAHVEELMKKGYALFTSVKTGKNQGDKDKQLTGWGPEAEESEALILVPPIRGGC